MMVVRSLNNTAFAGQDLELPQFNGPDTITIWVQSLLYASLGASLFAALGAVLGKEWLSHYALIGERGTVEDRCIDRQQKSIGLKTWHFDLVLACIPLLLQVSLLLFGIALSAYMWGQQRTIGYVIMSITAIGIILYSMLVLCSLLFQDCPFHTPVTDILSSGAHRLSSGISRMRRALLQVYSDRSSAVRSRISRSMRRTKRRLRALPHKCLDSLRHPSRLFPSMRETKRRLRRLRDKCLENLRRLRSRLFHSVAPGGDVEMAARSPIVHDPLIRSQETDKSHGVAKKDIVARRQVDASCVEWLLLTSTDPDVITIASQMALQVEWQLFTSDVGPMLELLRELFIRCIAHSSSATPESLSSTHETAFLYFRLMVYVQHQSTKEVVWTLPDSMLKFLRSPYHDPDLRFMCDALQVLFHRCWPGGRELPGPELDVCYALEDPNPPLPQLSLIDWFSHQMLFSLRNPKISPGARIWFAVTVSRWLEVPIGPQMSRKAQANCLLASAMLAGYNSPGDVLRGEDKRCVSSHPLHLYVAE